MAKGFKVKPACFMQICKNCSNAKVRRKHASLSKMYVCSFDESENLPGDKCHIWLCEDETEQLSMDIMKGAN